jgi:hypothetical protein
MVVRLKKDQFTAGDMVIAVRSRRRAKPTAGFYGAGASEMKRVIVGGTTMNPTSKVVRVAEESTPISATVSDKGEQFKDSDEYFSTEPVKEVQEVQEVQEVPSLEEQVREESQDALNERARRLLTEIEEDVRQMNRIKLEKESLKRSSKKNTEFSIQNQLEFLINEVYR